MIQVVEKWKITFEWSTESPVILFVNINYLMNVLNILCNISWKQEPIRISIDKVME